MSQTIRLIYCLAMFYLGVQEKVAMSRFPISPCPPDLLYVALKALKKKRVILTIS